MLLGSRLQAHGSRKFLKPEALSPKPLSEAPYSCEAAVG
jgi:hypothetical protein